VNFNVNINILKKFNCGLVGRIKDLITLRCTVKLWGGGENPDDVPVI
jgi:hypothetical protein